jgi:hypothetical protein
VSFFDSEGCVQLDPEELRQFYNMVRERDGWRCRMCGRTDVPLGVRMICEPYWCVGYVMENAITLCVSQEGPSCYRLAVGGVFVAGGLGTEGYREKDLYARICSSFSIAADATDRQRDGKGHRQS